MTGFEISAASAVFAGLLSFLSPCVLPLVPPYLAYLAGVRAEQASAAKIPKVALCFVAGLSTVFIALGATASLIGQSLSMYREQLSWISGVLIILFGVHFLGLFRLSFLLREARFNLANHVPSALSAYILGLAFAFGWTPCIGPILGSILFLAAEQQTFYGGLGLLALYSMGLGIPFILAALFMDRFVLLSKKMRPKMVIVEKITGALLVVIGISFLSGDFTRFSGWLLNNLPFLANLG